ncbi:MAG: 3-phosphoshikimate 1-carboxyvinyltransferase [Planctomycetaceae bacterium]
MPLTLGTTAGRSLRGTVRVPGDKSISHRALLFGAIAEGTTRIEGLLPAEDPLSTAACLRAMGVEVSPIQAGQPVLVQGVGLDGFHEPEDVLDCGNSGTTMRLMLGLLAGRDGRHFVVNGDGSLRRRPMKRVGGPLAEMGATIAGRAGGNLAPLAIQGRPLLGATIRTPVASAQVKSCVLFAGLSCDGETSVTEPHKTRDHSEIALREFGAEIRSEGRTTTVKGGVELQARELYVPGDLSGAAFFLVAALMSEEANVVLYDVGVNPSRTALIDFLVGGGGQVKVLDVRSSGGELVGDLQVRSSKFQGGVIEKGLTAALIDEIPVLAVLGATSENGLTVRDASELRVKETDRIATVADNLRRMGIEIETAADGFHIPGKQTFRAAEVDSFGDHRIGMAFAVAGLVAEGGETVVNEAEAASVSFPEFFTTLESIRA